jgi:Ulp1 protease family, C-terminal catalytic domain
MFALFFRHVKKYNIFEQRVLLVPLHKDFHWMLLAVYISEKTICYYDSFFGDGERYLTCKCMSYWSDCSFFSLTTFRFAAMLDFLECEAEVRPNPRATKAGESASLGCSTFKRSEWKLKSADRASMPDQSALVGDIYNCGVYVIVLMDFISSDLPLLFDHSDIEMCRKKICLEIVDLKELGVDLLEDSDCGSDDDDAENA